MMKLIILIGAVLYLGSTYTYANGACIDGGSYPLFFENAFSFSNYGCKLLLSNFES